MTDEPLGYQEIVATLAASRAAAPARWVEDYVAHPTDVTDLAMIEQEYQIALPTDYREFLVKVGSGAGVGLWSPRRVLDELHDMWDDFGQECGAVPSPSRAFQFGRSSLDEYIRRVDTFRTDPSIRYPEMKAALRGVFPADGFVPIAGSGNYLSALVTAGEMTGTVWEVDVGEFYTADGAGWVPGVGRAPFGAWSFSTWYRELIGVTEAQFLRSPTR